MANCFTYKVDREIVGSVRRSLCLGCSPLGSARYAHARRNPFQKDTFPIILSIKCIFFDF